jgi:hypothetical protein
MSDVENGDVLRVAAVMQVLGISSLVNVWHLKVMSGGPVDFPSAAMDVGEYMDSLYGAITTQLSDEVVADHLELQNVTQDLTYGSFAWTSWAGGSNTAAVTGTQVSLLAFARTTLPRVQIRKYLGVFTQNQLVDSEWISGTRSACGNMMAYHINSQTMSVSLNLKGVAYNDVLARATEALSYATSKYPVIQRRRRIGTGA